MAEGRSNQGIADELIVTVSAVERHVTNIFEPNLGQSQIGHPAQPELPGCGPGGRGFESHGFTSHSQIPCKRCVRENADAREAPGYRDHRHACADRRG